MLAFGVLDHVSTSFSELERFGKIDFWHKKQRGQFPVPAPLLAYATANLMTLIASESTNAPPTRLVV